MLLRDQVERQVLAERQVAAVLIAAGAKKVNMPSLDEEWAKLDAALQGEPDDDPERRDFLAAFGLS